jgi:hypothetical protein
MAFIGNTPTTQAFTPAVDYFSGNGSTTAFTLSRPVASVAQVQVVIDNVAQNPSSAYTISGSTITFTSAPLSGTNNIYVYYTSPITQVIAPGQGTVTTTSLNTSSLAIPVANVTGVTPAVVSDQANTSTGYFDLPAGTTAQRPGSFTSGQTRYNTTLGVLEYSDGTYWYSITATNNSAYSADYLVVAGGGGGRNYAGGGGGGTASGTTTLIIGTTYTATVGAGGIGGNSVTDGNNSVFSSFTATKGYCGTSAFGVAGASGNGYTGGTGANLSNPYLGGGGAGAGANGNNYSGSTAGSGGNGISSTITGSTTYYGGGGGGGVEGAGSRGAGATTYGGGNGSGAVGSPAGSAGTANTGGGGGGGDGGNTTNGFAGGSGVVIISVPSSKYTGTTTGSPTITTSGSNTIIKFTSSGTYTA